MTSKNDRGHHKPKKRWVALEARNDPEVKKKWKPQSYTLRRQVLPTNVSNQ